MPAQQRLHRIPEKAGLQTVNFRAVANRLRLVQSILLLRCGSRIIIDLGANSQCDLPSLSSGSADTNLAAPERSADSSRASPSKSKRSDELFNSRLVARLAFVPYMKLEELEVASMELLPPFQLRVPPASWKDSGSLELESEDVGNGDGSIETWQPKSAHGRHY